MPEIKLNARHFEEMLTRRGMPVSWQRAQKCTCWSDTSGQPLNNCLACSGIGYLYDAPIETSYVLLTSLMVDKEFTPLGEYTMGDCILTVPKHYKAKVDGKWAYLPHPLYDVGDWDKIIPRDTEFRTGEILIRGESIYGRPADTLRNEKITDIIRILQADPDTGTITEYVKDTDYTLNGQSINWITGPAIGTKYSVLYLYKPIYIVYQQLPQRRDQDGQHFPRKVVLRLLTDI